jgi:virginiamycin B lyase
MRRTMFLGSQRAGRTQLTALVGTITMLVLSIVGAGLPRPVRAQMARSDEGPADNPATISTFTIPTANSVPSQITAGPDGNFWFTESGTDKIGRMTADGVFTEFPLAQGSGPYGIVTGADDALWFTEQSANRIGRMDVSGNLTEFPIPTPASGAQGITTGPDLNLWFAERDAGKIGKITTSGTVTEVSVPTAGSTPSSLAPGPDGNVWFTDPGANQVGMVTPSGMFTVHQIPTVNSSPGGITPGPDGNLWFAEEQGNKIGWINPASANIGEASLGTAGTGPFAIVPIPDGSLCFTEKQAGQIMKVIPTATGSPVPAPVAQLPNAAGISRPLVNPRVDSDNFMDALLACLNPDFNQVGVVTLPGAVKGFQGGYTGQLSLATGSGQPSGQNSIGIVNLQIVPGVTATAQATVLFTVPVNPSAITITLAGEIHTIPVPGPLTGPTIFQTPIITFQPPATPPKPVFKFDAKIEDRRYSTIFAFDPTFRHFAEKKVTVPPGGTAQGTVNTLVSPGATVTPGIMKIVPVLNMVPSPTGGYVIQGLPPNPSNIITLPGSPPNGWDPNNPGGRSFLILSLHGHEAADYPSDATNPEDYTFAVVTQTGDLVNISSFPVTVGGPDFSLGLDQSTVNAKAGSTALVTVNINRTGGFTGKVTVTPPAPAGGIKAKPPHPITTANRSVLLKFKIARNASAGSHQLVIKGTDSSGRERDVTLTLVIN